MSVLHRVSRHAPKLADRPIVLIHGIERRIRALGYDPQRSFDVRHGWTLTVDDAVVATGSCLSELAHCAADWLASRETTEPA